MCDEQIKPKSEPKICLELSADDRKQLFDETVKEFGKIDISF